MDQRHGMESSRNQGLSALETTERVSLIHCTPLAYNSFTETQTVRFAARNTHRDCKSIRFGR